MLYIHKMKHWPVAHSNRFYCECAIQYKYGYLSLIYVESLVCSHLGSEHAQ